MNFIINIYLDPEINFDFKMWVNEVIEIKDVTFHVVNSTGKVPPFGPHKIKLNYADNRVYPKFMLANWVNWANLENDHV